MERRRAARSGRIARCAAFFLSLAACGSRTGLFTEGAPGPNPTDGGTEAGRLDGGRDAGQEEAPPPIDASFRDADRTGCPDAATTYVYLISDDYRLYSFDPDTNDVSQIGSITCPVPPGSSATPFSMAVDRRGVAYVLFNDGRLYRVSTATAACIGTSFVPDQANYHLFGMGFATNGGGPTETLYVAGTGEAEQGIPTADGLARIDVGNFKLTPIGSFAPPIYRAELTGTADGRLFGFYRKAPGQQDPPTYIGEIDVNTGRILGENEMVGVRQGEAWAFAFWGGDFYMFTAAVNDTSRITRYRPSTRAIGVVASVPTRVVGAGVSTCAPQD
jgi:hypothetical protein